ncbi:hypothetical protein H0H93_005350 [Arthromyces matolae]|nr:hypothetical protein H0H93_005350 [Arthromyces matolae]
MKTCIVSQGLAVMFLGTVFLACGASPIASNPNTIVQHNALPSALPTASLISSNAHGIYSIPDPAVDVELREANRLTRRDGRSSPVPDDEPTGTAAEPPQRFYPPTEGYFLTPMVCATYLRQRQTDDRNQRMERWKRDRVVSLEAKVDRLHALGVPTWLLKACWEDIDFEDRLIHWFKSEVLENSEEYTVIMQHEEDIKHVKEKLLQHGPRLGVPPPIPDVEKDPRVICQKSNNQSRSVHSSLARPRSRSPSQSKRSEANPPQQLSSSINKLHTKARRGIIDQWSTQGLKREIELLADFAFPIWSVDDCTYRISNSISLLAIFEEEEKRYGGTSGDRDKQKYLDLIESHRHELSRLKRELLGEHQQFLDEGLKYILPAIKEGGDWRNVVKHFVTEVKRLHLYDHRDQGYDQIDAGLKVYRTMAIPHLITMADNEELLVFRNFLCDQEEELRKAEEEFRAGKHEHGSTISKSR